VQKEKEQEEKKKLESEDEMLAKYLQHMYDEDEEAPKTPKLSANEVCSCVKSKCTTCGKVVRYSS